MRAALAITVMVMLAGCGAPQETPAPVAEDTQDVHATATTGIVRCVVVDEAIRPLPGVMVLFDGALQYTDGDGACAFGDLLPGTYNLTASKRGYLKTEVLVGVEAGIDAPDTVRVVLPTDPDDTPRVDTYVHKGRITCGLSVAAVCGAGPLADATEDGYTAVIPVDEAPDHMTIEAVWTSSQPTAHNLSLQMGGTPVSPSNACCEVAGESPIQLVANALTTRDMGLGPDADLFTRIFATTQGHGQQAPEDGCEPGVPPFACDGVAAVLLQDFELFVHAFHNHIPEGGYRFTQDGAPPEP